MYAAAIVLHAFFDVCRFRLRPQDLPASGALLGFAVAGYLCAEFLLASIELAPGSAALTALLDAAALAGFTALVLAVRGYRERLLQTLTALAGSGLVLGLIAWPVARWLAAARAAGQDPGAAALVWLALLVWSLLVCAHVYRHALATRFAVGLGVSVLYVWLLVTIAWTVFPPRPAMG